MYTEIPVNPVWRFSLFHAGVWETEQRWARVRDLYRNTGNALGLSRQQAAIRWLDEQDIAYHWEWRQCWTRKFGVGPNDVRRTIMLEHYVCFDRKEDAALFRLFHEFAPAGA